MSHRTTRSQVKKMEENEAAAAREQRNVPTDSGLAADGGTASNTVISPETSSVPAAPEGHITVNAPPPSDGEPPLNTSERNGSVRTSSHRRRTSEVKSIGSHASRHSQRTTLEAQRRQIELEIAKERAKIREEILDRTLAARLAEVEASVAVYEEGDERRSQSEVASASRVQEWVNQSPPTNFLAPVEQTFPPAMEIKTYEPPPPPQAPRTTDESSERRHHQTEVLEAIASISRSRPRQAYELPKFDGGPADWIAFKKRYDRSTAAYKFDSFENVARLQQAVIGPARAAVETILLTSDDPEEIMRVLEDEFGHPGAIIECALKKIRSLPYLTESGQDLKKFTRIVRNSVSLLKNVNVVGYVNSAELVCEVLNKLTSSQRALYAKFAKNRDRETKMDLRVSPSLDILLEFLSEESSSVAYSMPPSLASSGNANRAPLPAPPRLRVAPAPAPRNVHRVAVVSAAPSSSSPSVSSPRVLDCTLCHGNHVLPTCTQFLALTNDARWEVVRENGLCFKCLSQRHSRMFCRAKRCDQCRAPHHMLLHYTRVASERPPLLPPPSLQEANVEQVSSVSGRSSKALLKIVPVVIVSESGETIKSHVLLDDGATVSLISEYLLPSKTGETCPLTIVAANGQSVTDNKSRKVSVTIRGPNGQSHKVNMRTLTQLNLPSQVVPETVFENDHLIDLRDSVQCNGTDIDQDHVVGGEMKPLLLLGQDNWELIVGEEIRRGKSGQPIASLTKLGWVIHGPIGSKYASTSGSDCESVHCLAVVNKLDMELHNLVKNQFALESIGISEVARTNVETERANDILEKTSRRVEGGWEVGLLWKRDDTIFPNNYTQALNRLKGIERRMDRDPLFGAAYEAQVDRLIKEGYAEKVESRGEAGPKWYLPHFAVVNPNKPGKLRLVFDAAATYKGVCLNSYLLSGPALINSLFGVLIRFRVGKVAIKGDIADMFLRVKIREEDRGAQLFLWRGKEREQAPNTYVMKSLIFGATSSPATAIYILNKNAHELGDRYPDAVGAVLNKHYVDDYLDSFTDETEARDLIDQVTQVHAQGGFRIRGWVTNSPTLNENLVVSTENVEFGKSLDQIPTERTLGLIWSPQDDNLSFDVSLKRVPENIVKGEMIPTKRQYLRVVMSIFDPVGYLSPAIIPTRILLQQIWKSGVGWDQKLQDREAELWLRWISVIDRIKHVKIPRWYNLELENLELHVFGDASELAYAAVAYLVGNNKNGERECTLVAAKARVASLKVVSIPRLELQAAVLACRLSNSIKDELGVNISRTFLWSDSQTVLKWISSDARDFQRFVSHRLSEIEEKSERSDWRWVPSLNNPADEATKLGWPREQSIWFSGPPFLRAPPHMWPAAVPVDTEIEDTELKIAHTINSVSVTQSETLIDLKRFSSWKRATRVIARALAFVRRCRGRKTTDIERHDIIDGERMLLKESQKKEFNNEIVALRAGKSLPRNSKLKALDPMLFEDGLLRVKGRIGAASQLSFDERHPIILDGRGTAAQLIIKEYHERCAHSGPEHVVNMIREKYWITNLRNAVKGVMRSCYLCTVLRGQPSIPKMADLPPARLHTTRRAFVHCGVDYFGPMETTIGRRHEKRWGVLFTCLSTRAVHLELAASLNIDSAILALRRLIARRGKPESMRSDRGTNFIGANNELRAALREFPHDKFGEAATAKGIQWIFNPPAAPHMGGIWERLVRSVKSALKTTLKQRAPKEEVLHTLLLEAELVVNSRPLCYVAAGDASSPTVLTPNHLLLGTGSGDAPFAQSSPADLDARRQWRRANALADEFWRRWRREYLPTLQRRTKWRSDVINVQVGNIVLICDDAIPRNQWPKGKIIKLITARDGKVRVVDLKTVNGVVRRPVAKIIVLSTGDNCSTPLYEDRVTRVQRLFIQLILTRARESKPIGYFPLTYSHEI